MAELRSVDDALTVLEHIAHSSQKVFLDSGAFSFMKKRERLGIRGVSWPCMVEYCRGLQQYIRNGYPIYTTPSIFSEQERRLPRFPAEHPFSSALTKLLQEIKQLNRIYAGVKNQHYLLVQDLVELASKEHQLSLSDKEVWIAALATSIHHRLPVALLSDDGGIACAHEKIQNQFPNIILYDRLFGGACGTPFMRLTKDRLLEKSRERAKARNIS